MLPLIYIIIGVWLLYMATGHPTEKWDLDGKQYTAPRIVVFAKKFVEG